MFGFNLKIFKEVLTFIKYTINTQRVELYKINISEGYMYSFMLYIILKLKMKENCKKVIRFRALWRHYDAAFYHTLITQDGSTIP